MSSHVRRHIARLLLSLTGALSVTGVALADEQKKAPPPGNAALPAAAADQDAKDAKDGKEAKAEADATAAPAEVTVRGDKPASEAASRVNVSRRDLELRPRLRPGDILEATPGLFAVQHAGGGKANQYFLRGFDADHGTDVAFFVDGVPTNMVSHGHGQGYTDVHFLIPELVVSLDAYKGPYYAQFGDFATAGALNMRLAESFDESFASLQVGQYGIARGLVVASPKLGDDWRAVAAAEVFKDNGPFQNPEKLQRFNVFLRATHDVGKGGKLSMTWMSYGSRWNGSGQIPARAVCGEGEAGAAAPSLFGQPCIDHFGNVDPTEGGATQRHQASIAYTATSHDSDLSAMAYATRYRFNLYSNFTFFDRDPVNGDQIEQSDDRTVLGGDFRFRRHFHYGPSKISATFGTQVRADSIENGLYDAVKRERVIDRVDAGVTESQIAAYAEADARLTNQIRFIAGLRAERIDVSVHDRLEDKSTLGTASSGERGDAQLLPKLMAVYSPLSALDLFASYGRGFHSNDARGAVLGQNRARLMTPATGYEVGARLSPAPGLTLNAAAFLLDLESEIVWVGDEGTTEASDGSRRYGAELGARYRISNWLYADIDATFTRARYRANAGNGDAVALAPTRTLTAGIGARPKFGDWTPFGSMRLKALADRPANEDGSLTAQGFTMIDLNAGARYKDVEAGVDVQNLLDSRWREVNFASSSRLPYEPEAVTGIHYSPGWPRTVMGRVTLYWQ